MNSKYKVLVTGAAGFLGSHLVEKLHNLGHTVIGIDNMMGGYKDNIIEGIEFHELDCCDLQKVQKIMKGVEIVYHCAATAHEGLSVFSPYEITKNNYLASVSIFSAAVNEKVKRIIFCSSMARYGSQKYPFTEEMKPFPISPYAVGKYTGEIYALMMNHVYKHPITRMATIVIFFQNKAHGTAPKNLVSLDGAV